MTQAIRRFALALSCLAASSCDDTLLCPAIHIYDSLMLAFDDATWSPGTYAITIDCDSLGKKYRVECQVRIPGFDPDASDDAGMASFDGDERPDYFTCTSSPEMNDSAPKPLGVLGRKILLTIYDAPREVRLIVRDREGTIIVDRTDEPKYEPAPGACASDSHARIAVEL